MTKILIVDDEKSIRDSLKIVLDDEGYNSDVAADGEEGLNLLKENNYDVIISDIKMPKIGGIELMGKAAEFSPESFFIIMTAYASVDTAIDALRKGAYDYLLKPIEFDDVLIRVKRLLKFKSLAHENKILRQRISTASNFENIVGQSDAMHEVFDIIEQVAKTNSNVLITGKSGTGKEMTAKALHSQSDRKNEIFLPVNCGAIPENLIESELFGHKKGSFTGAFEDKPGLFKVADGGTLFLDEIGELPLSMQVKLLRALEERKFLQVGGTKHISTNVRIIAATNQDLLAKVRKGEFREDLYYRLNVVEIKLPALSDRRDDIPLLVNHFVEKLCNEMAKKIVSVDNATMRILMNHDWPGGVRELENVIERAIIFAKDGIIRVNNLPDQVKGIADTYDFPDALKDAVKNFEKSHIKNIIKKFDFNKDEAAKALQIGLSSLYRKMEDLGIPTKT